MEQQPTLNQVCAFQTFYGFHFYFYICCSISTLGFVIKFNLPPQPHANGLFFHSTRAFVEGTKGSNIEFQRLTPMRTTSRSLEAVGLSATSGFLFSLFHFFSLATILALRPLSLDLVSILRPQGDRVGGERGGRARVHGGGDLQLGGGDLPDLCTRSPQVEI